MDAGKPSPRLLEEDAKLRNDVAAAELISTLDAAGIESILIKGPSVSRWLYDEAESRPYGDVDLLVPPERFSDAERVAASLGFRHLKVGDHLEEVSRHRSCFREMDGVCVELHRGFVGVGVADREFWNELAQQTVPLALGVMGVTARIPGVPARALLVALHAASHGAVGTPFTDLHRALARLPDDTWDKAAALAHRLQAQPAFAVGLSLSARGGEIVRRLGLEPVAQTSALLGASDPPPTTKGWEWFAQSPGAISKARFVIGKLAPPLDFMRVVDPIGQRGGAWLVVAYVVRPMRLAIQAPSGFRAWRDVRRRASHE